MGNSRKIESEKVLEKKLVSEVWNNLNAVALKFTSTSETGYPDRLCLTQGGGCFWVELKTTGKKPTKLQQHRHQQLRAIGHRVYVVDSSEGINELITTEKNITDKIC